MTIQRIDPPPMNGKRFIALMALTFGAGLLALGVSRLLIRLTGVGLFDTVFFASVIVILLLLVRKTALRYLYAVGDGRVQIAKYYGDKINTLVELRAGDVLGVVRYEAGMDLKKYRSVTRMASKKSVHAVLLYRQDGAQHALLFAPNEAILAALREEKNGQDEVRQEADGNGNA